MGWNSNFHHDLWALRSIQAIPSGEVFCKCPILILTSNFSGRFGISVIMLPTEPTKMAMNTILFINHNLYISYYHYFPCFLLLSRMLYFFRDMKYLWWFIFLLVYLYHHIVWLLLLLLLLLYEGVKIYKVQYSHFNTQSDRCIPGTCITAKCAWYCDRFW